MRRMDMLNGSIWDKMLMFALPLAASSALQQLFNSADVAVVGHFVGNAALAAVGANGSVINLLVNMFIGLSLGSNVVISTLLGSGNHEDAGRAAHTSVLLALTCGTVMAVVGNLLARPILTAMGTDPEVLPLAVIYLRIYCAGLPAIMLYNFCASILRSKGDTARPVLALAAGGIINVALNLFLVIVCGRSVDGVAIATVVSNIISSSVLMYFLTHEDGPLHITIGQLRYHGALLKEIARVGIPAGVQGMMFQIANVIIISSLNSLGVDALAGSTAGLNYEYFSYFLLSGFSQAAVSFVGQNYGAGNLPRCRRCVRWALLLGGIFTEAFSLFCIAFRYPLAGIFTSDEAAVQYAVLRMMTILPFSVCNMMLEVFSGGLRGLGHSAEPAAMSILCICVLRLVWVGTVFQAYHEYAVLLRVYSISWMAADVAIGLSYLLVMRRLQRRAAETA